MMRTALLVGAICAGCTGPSETVGRNDSLSAPDEESLDDAAGLRIGLVSVFIPRASATDCETDASPEQCIGTHQQVMFDATRDWYRTVLGFDVVVDEQLDTVGTAGRWLQMAFPGHPELSIVFKAGTPVTDNAILTIMVDTPDLLCAHYGRLRDMGIDFQLPPSAHPWAFEMMLPDLWGQSIVVAVPLDGTPSGAVDGCSL